MAKSKKGKSGGKSKGAKKEKAPKASKKDKKDKGSKKGKKGGSKKDMEAAKLRAEKEEQERLKKEAEEKALAEKKLAIEMAERPGHLIDSLKVIQTYDKWVIGKLDRHKNQREWKSFKVCRNIPDFTKLYEVNSYMSFWLSQLDPPGMKKLLKLSPEILQLVSELHTFLQLPPDCMSLDLIRELGLVYRDILDYQKTYLDKCTYSILEDLSTLHDPEMGICDYLLSIPEITHCLWGNIFQCPDINEHEFEELKFKFKIPEALLTAAGIYRLVKTEYDHYSDSCLSYFPPGVENALKQSIIDWMELHKMTGGEYYDLPSPVEEKPSKGKGKGKGKGKKKGSKKKKGKKGSKGKKKGKKKGDDSDLSDLDDDLKFLMEDEDDGKKKKKGKKKGKEKKGKKGKKGKGGGGTTTEESGVSTTEGEETTGGEEEGDTTTGGEEEEGGETTDHEKEKKIGATKIPTDAELLASTKETKEERRARRRREAEQADDDEDNFDGGPKEAAVVEDDESTASVAADKKGKKAKDKDADKDKGEETGDDEDSKKAKGGKKGDVKGKGAKPKKDSSGGDDEAGPTAYSDYDDDDVDADDTKPAAAVAEEKAEDQAAPEEKKKSDEGGRVEEDASTVRTKAKGGKSKKRGNVKKSKKKKKSGKKTKKEKEAERKEGVKEALNEARGRIKKEGKIKTKAGEGKKSKKGKKGKKKAKGSEESLGGTGKSKKEKGDKKGKSKSKEKGKTKGSSDSKGKSKEKDKKAKSPAKAKAKPKPKAAKSKSKSPGGSKAKAKKDKGGSKSKKDKKKDKGSKSKGKKDKKDKSRSKSKKKGKKGKKGGKSKSKERHKTEAELAKERERAEKAKFIPQLHEHELNLRNYTILGGVFDFNLYCIPSQPKMRTKWTVHLRETNSTLKELAFEADYTPPIPPDQDSAKKTPEEMEKEAKHQEEELTKLLMPEIPKLPPTQAEIEEEEERQKELFAQMVAEYEVEKEKRLALLVLVEIESPRVALWFEPPTPVRWDPLRKVWSTEGFYDIRFNENNLQLSFRTVRFGTLAFGHNRWSNLPYQSWEIKPLGKDKVSFSLTAAIAVIDFIVFGDLICVTSIQNVTNGEEVEAALLNKYMKPHNLIKTMRYHGLDIFPEIDSYAYVDGVLVKHFESEDHLYQCMAVACSAFNFQWSRWNLLAGREKMIYQMRERHGTATPANYSMVLTTPRNTLRINCTEVSPNYTEEAVDNEYNADLLNLVKATATDQGLKVMNQSNPHHVEALRVLLASVRPLSFS